MANTTGKKFGGRKKGTPNKRTVDLQAMLEAKFPGYDPVVQLAGFANDETIETNLRINAAKEVAKYVRPQLKAVELSTQSGQGILLNWDTGIKREDK